MYRILIAESDKTWNYGIAQALKTESCLLYQAFELEKARKLLQNQKVQLVILGLRFPEKESCAFLKELRENYGIPTVILASAGPDSVSDSDITDFLRSFSLAALRSRIDAQLHKTPGRSLQVYQSGEYYFSFYKMEFSKGDRRVELSKAEQRLLQLLVGNRGFTLPGNELMAQIREEDPWCTDEATLSEAVRRLRDKLEDDPAMPRYIKTVCGIGYTWADGRNLRSCCR